MAAEFHVGDVGTIIRSTIVDQGSEIVDLSGATVKQYLLEKPDKSVAELNCTLFTDGLDGIMQFITVADTFDQAGFYNLQGYIEVSTNEWHTNTVRFRVYPNLN